MLIKTPRFIYLFCAGILLSGAAFVLQGELKLGKVPAALPRIDTSFNGLTWQQIINEHFRSFSYRGKIGECRRLTEPTFAISYESLESDYTEKKERFYSSVVKKLYQTPAAQKALYYWVKDHYLKAWKTLPEMQKNCYEEMLRYAKSYLDSFDYKGELECYNREMKREPGFWFAFTGPKGKRGPYGHMEAFIGRRLFRKEMTLAQMKGWVKIAIADLERMEKKKD
jgi:hypothetical protein